MKKIIAYTILSLTGIALLIAIVRAATDDITILYAVLGIGWFFAVFWAIINAMPESKPYTVRFQAPKIPPPPPIDKSETREEYLNRMIQLGMKPRDTNTYIGYLDERPDKDD